MNLVPLRPLICPETVYDFSRITTSEELSRLIDSGDIGLAFDLRSKRSVRGTIRIYWGAFLDYVEKRKWDGDLDAAIRSILGQPRESISQHFLASCLKLSPHFVKKLVSERRLSLLEKPRRKSGPGSSPKIFYASAKSFLIAARIL